MTQLQKKRLWNLAYWVKFSAVAYRIIPYSIPYSIIPYRKWKKNPPTIPSIIWSPGSGHIHLGVTFCLVEWRRITFSAGVPRCRGRVRTHEAASRSWCWCSSLVLLSARAKHSLASSECVIYKAHIYERTLCARAVLKEWTVPFAI